MKCNLCKREVVIDNLNGKPWQAKGFCVGFHNCHQQKEQKKS